jgi:hypothetical protein
MCMPKIPSITPVTPAALPEPVKPVEVTAARIPDAPPPAEKSAMYIGNQTTTEKVSTSNTLAKRPGFSSLRIPLLSGLNIPR